LPDGSPWSFTGESLRSGKDFGDPIPGKLAQLVKSTLVAKIEDQAQGIKPALITRGAPFFKFGDYSSWK